MFATNTLTSTPQAREVLKRVADRDDGDVPSQLVADLRLESSVLCRSLMAAPWGFAVPRRADGSFHLLLTGHGWLEVDGHEDRVHLRAGDVAVLPHGSGHRVRDSARSAAPPLMSILTDHPLVDGELHFGAETGPTTEIVCGTFHIHGGRPPWFDQLGPVARSPGSSPGTAWRGAVAAALRDEARAPTVGGAAIVNRWLESLIADALRRQLAEASARNPSLDASLSDDRIGRLLAEIHGRPEASWSVASMARVAAMSRSAFAVRFRALVGESPARYVTRLRLNRAERLLVTTDATVAEIARRVGYQSEEALSRAVKVRFGAAPSVIRRRIRRSPAESSSA